MNGNSPRPKRDRYEIEALLLEAMNSTQRRQNETASEFLRVSSAVPYDSHSDGALSIKTASEARSRALAEYQIALKRFTDFILHGIVPDDLK